MDAGTMKLKEIESALFGQTPSAEFLAACEADDRAGVQKLVKRYRRMQEGTPALSMKPAAAATIRMVSTASRIRRTRVRLRSFSFSFKYSSYLR